MKKPNFSVAKFESANIQTLQAEELNFIMGASQPVQGLCSNNGDSDSQSSGCSVSADKDDH